MNCTVVSAQVEADDRKLGERSNVWDMCLRKHMIGAAHYSRTNTNVVVTILDEWTASPTP